MLFTSEAGKAIALAEWWHTFGRMMAQKWQNGGTLLAVK